MSLRIFQSENELVYNFLWLLVQYMQTSIIRLFCLVVRDDTLIESGILSTINHH